MFYSRAVWLKIVRRTHLYTGLILVPWVLVYAFSGMLFNHPGLFSDDSTTHYGAEALAGSQLESPPTAREFVEALLPELEKKFAEASGTKAKLGAPRNSRLYGGYELEGNEKGYWISIDAEGGGLSLHRYAHPPRDEHPLATIEELSPQNKLWERNGQNFVEVTKSTGLSDTQLEVVRAPMVSFELEVDRRMWELTYNPLDGRLEAQVKREGGGARALRTVATDMHKTHVYPSVLSARWLWSLMTDILAIFMLLWAITGVVMWWQLKKLRRLGMLLLMGGFASMLYLLLALF